jgi:hypothetical protein
VREPARTPHAARQRYTRILQESLSCLTKAHWFVGPSPSDDENLSLAVSEDPVRLRRSNGRSRLFLAANQLFTIVPDERFEGEWKARTLAYVYSVQLDPKVSGDGEPEVIAWHWHPPSTPDRPEPHVHVRVDHPQLDVTLSKLHIPTARVSFEEVIRFLIADLHVDAVRGDWKEVVGESETRFKAWRTWS